MRRWGRLHERRARGGDPGEGALAGGPRARSAAWLVGLWAILTAARWLAALPIDEPRIFRDELLHWQMAKALFLGERFLFFGSPVDYPAVLYPAVLSVVFALRDAAAAFDLARGLNAAMVSAVVFPAYGLARELCGPSASRWAAVLAGLVPGGVYAALIMEESLYYPLFVLACWLCFRVLERGDLRDALACAAALCLAYFTKPLIVLLVAAYAIMILAWSLLNFRGGGLRRARLAGMATRCVPLLGLGLALLARNALADHGGATTAARFLLGGLYAGEFHSRLLPPLAPLGLLALALFVALTLGTAVAPMAALLRGLGNLPLRDRRAVWFLSFTAVALGLYLLGVARHPLVNQDSPRIHERYLFALAPMVFTAFLALPPDAARPTWRVSVPLLAGVIVALGPLAYVTLTRATMVDAPSLTLAWVLRRASGSVLLAAAAMGALAVLALLWGRVAAGRPPVGLACLAGTLVLLNAAWYAYLGRQTHLVPYSTFVRWMEAHVEGADRITVIQDGREETMRLSLYLRFWLDAPVSSYWIAGGAKPWYADLAGSPAAAAAFAAPGYLVAPPGFEDRCPGARLVRRAEASPPLPAVVLRVPLSGCGAATGQAARAAGSR